MKLKPLGDRVVVLPVEQDDQTASGLFLPETAKEKPQQGKVLSTGPGSRQTNGNLIPLDIKIDDIVLYAKYAGTAIKVEGQEYLIFKEADLLAIVDSVQK
jgi:chaperonin GroES